MSIGTIISYVKLDHCDERIIIINIFIVQLAFIMPARAGSFYNKNYIGINSTCRD